MQPTPGTNYQKLKVTAESLSHSQPNDRHKYLSYRGTQMQVEVMSTSNELQPQINVTSASTLQHKFYVMSTSIQRQP